MIGTESKGLIRTRPNHDSDLCPSPVLRLDHEQHSDSLSRFVYKQRALNHFNAELQVSTQHLLLSDIYSLHNMSSGNQQKRRGDQQAGGPPKSQGSSSSHHPPSKHSEVAGSGSGSGSSSTNMSSASATAYENAMNQFEEFCAEYRKAHAEYKANVLKESNKYHASRSRISIAYAQALQDIADNAKPEEVQQQKEAKLKEIAHEKLEAIGQVFNQAMQRAGSLATPEEQSAARRRAQRMRTLAHSRAKKEAQRTLYDPAEANAAAQTPEGDEIKSKFDKMFQNAKEDVDRGLTQIESHFIGEIKDLIAKQQGLSQTMDAANLGDKNLVELDEKEARDMVNKTQSAGKVIERLHRNERDQPRVKVEDGDKGKGRA